MQLDYLRKIPPNKLKTTYISERLLQLDYEQLLKWKGRFIGPGVIAFAYQQGHLSRNDFDLLFHWKNRDHGQRTEAQHAYRQRLVDVLMEVMAKWSNGEEIEPISDDHKKRPSKRECRVKKKTAREQFRADMRAKKAKSAKCRD